MLGHGVSHAPVVLSTGVLAALFNLLALGRALGARLSLLLALLAALVGRKRTGDYSNESQRHNQFFHFSSHRPEFSFLSRTLNMRDFIRGNIQDC